MTDWLEQKPPPARTRPSGSEAGAAASLGGGAVHGNGSRIRTRMEFRAFTDRAGPARSRVESDYRFEADHGASRVAGDRNRFNGATTVEAAREGSLVFSRTRRCSAPRGFL